MLHFIKNYSSDLYTKLIFHHLKPFSPCKWERYSRRSAASANFGFAFASSGVKWVSERSAAKECEWNWGSRVTPKKSKPPYPQKKNDSPFMASKNWSINYLLIVSHFRAIFTPTNVTRQRRLRPRQRQRQRLRRLRRRIASGDVTVCIHSLFSAIREINALCVDPTKQFAV